MTEYVDKDGNIAHVWVEVDDDDPDGASHYYYLNSATYANPHQKITNKDVEHYENALKGAYKFEVEDEAKDTGKGKDKDKGKAKGNGNSKGKGKGKGKDTATDQELEAARAAFEKVLEFERQTFSLHRIKLIPIPCPASASSASSSSASKSSSSAFRAICDCKMFWTCGFCKHERIVLHLESQLDLDQMNSKLRVNNKRGPKRKAASALQRQPESRQRRRRALGTALHPSRRRLRQSQRGRRGRHEPNEPWVGLRSVACAVRKQVGGDEISGAQVVMEPGRVGTLENTLPLVL